MKLFDYLCEDLGLIQTIGSIMILIIIGLLYIIQISKIEVNPLTCIARFIRRIFGIKRIDKRVDNLEAELKDFEFQICKSNILIFAQGLRDEESFSDLEWLMIFGNMDKYDELGRTDAFLESEIEFLKKSKEEIDSG